MIAPAKYNAPLPDRVCPVCQRAFHPENYRVTYCGNDCRIKGRVGIYGRMELGERALRYILIADGCWEWMGARQANGYGRIRLGIGTTTRVAHRVVYELLRGLVPAGMDLDHLCRNRGCVRPSHLEPVTRAENLRRARAAAVAVPA